MTQDNKQKTKKLPSRCSRDIVRDFILKVRETDAKKEDIAEELGVSRTTLWRYLEEMVAEGLVKKVYEPDWGSGNGQGFRIVVRGGAR